MKYYQPAGINELIFDFISLFDDGCIFVFDRERLDLLELMAQLELRELEESPVPMVLLAPLVPL